LALVFGDFFPRRLHRPVGGGVGDVHEEGLVGVVLFVVGGVAAGVIGDRISEVVMIRFVFGIVLAGDHRVVADQRGVVVVGGAHDDAVAVVEAALGWPVVLWCFRLSFLGDVPLADLVGAVAGGFHDLADGDAVGVEVADVAV